MSLPKPGDVVRTPMGHSGKVRAVTGSQVQVRYMDGPMAGRVISLPSAQVTVTHRPSEDTPL